MSKADRTKQYILEKTAPIFNKKGYKATSLSEITKATNLTKGAVYFYFKNKEELALMSFRENVLKVISPIDEIILLKQNSFERLYAITDFFRKKYYFLAKDIGGCPIINLGVDSQFNNLELFEEAKKVSKRIMNKIFMIIVDGIEQNEIKDSVDAKSLSMIIYSMIEGAIFMAFTNNEPDYLIKVTDYIDFNIFENIKN